MTNPTPPECRVALERGVLQSICSGAHLVGLPISEAKALLETYVWRDADNRVVFESLCGLSSSLSPAELREQLPAQATRLGFPDVDWENYLKTMDAVTTDVRRGIAQLLAVE